jgi:ABC-type glycerol-3-phosphate transport system permease component
MASASQATQGVAWSSHLTKLARWAGLALIAVVIVLGLVFTIYPFIFMLGGTLKTNKEIFSLPPTILPPTWQFQNWPALFADTSFARWLLNSVIVVVIRLPLSLFLCSLGAFALAKYQFPGRTIVFWLVIATIMVPFEAIYIPLYFIMLKLGWLDTYQALIVPFAASAFGIFMLRQYMVSVPDEFIDAAKVDGASGWWIYRSVMVPLSLPALGAIAIILFLATWNSYFWPIIAANGKEVLTIPLGLTWLISGGAAEAMKGPQWHLAMVVSTISILPLLLTFLLAQRQFIAGLTSGGVKGM